MCEEGTDLDSGSGDWLPGGHLPGCKLARSTTSPALSFPICTMRSQTRIYKASRALQWKQRCRADPEGSPLRGETTERQRDVREDRNVHARRDRGEQGSGSVEAGQSATWQAAAACARENVQELRSSTWNTAGYSPQDPKTRKQGLWESGNFN